MGGAEKIIREKLKWVLNFLKTHLIIDQECRQISTALQW